MDFVNWILGRDKFDIKKLGQAKNVTKLRIVDDFVHIPKNIISDEEERGRLFLKKVGKDIQKEKKKKKKKK